MIFKKKLFEEKQLKCTAHIAKTWPQGALQLGIIASDRKCQFKIKCAEFSKLRTARSYPPARKAAYEVD